MFDSKTEKSIDISLLCRVSALRLPVRPTKEPYFTSVKSMLNKKPSGYNPCLLSKFSPRPSKSDWTSFQKTTRLPKVSLPTVQLQLDKYTLTHLRQYGACWLANELWRTIQLDVFWNEKLGTSREGTHWASLLQISVAYRLIQPEELYGVAKSGGRKEKEIAIRRKKLAQYWRSSKGMRKEKLKEAEL